MRPREHDDVYAVEAGTILHVLRTPSAYGTRIYCRHADGSTAMYGHLSETHVREGQQVSQGKLIATIGETGNCPFGKHLHINYFTKGSPELTGAWSVDPTYWIMLHAYPTNTIVTGGFHQLYLNDKDEEYLHEGLDAGYNTLIVGWENGVDAMYQDYLLKRNYPELYKE